MSRMCYNKSMKERFGLIAASMLMLSCIGIASVSASEKDTDFVVDIDPQAMLVIPDTPVKLSVTPSQNGTFDTASFDVLASTNSKSGYTLTIETNKTHLESSYVDADTGIASRIPAMTFRDGGLSKNDFMNSTDENVLNHWGVSIDNETSFNPINNSMVIKRTASVANNDRTTINVATKINTDAELGIYSTTINFALVPNVVNIPQGVSGGEISDPSGGEGSNFAAGSLGRSYEIYYNEVLQKSVYVKDDSTPEGYHLLREGEDKTGKATYFAMQDMSSTICDRVTVIPDQLQVIDLRDAKVYWIAKLADGKCWMTQNLDYNLDSSVTLTPADTDIRQNWTPAVSSINHDGMLSTYIGSWYSYSCSYGVACALDMGDWYWIGNWDNNGTSTWYSYNNSYYPSGNVGDPPVFQFGQPFEGNGEHGHIGNYYNWNAAVAGNTEPGDGNKDTSICPAHWRLPHYGNSEHFDQNEYYQLMISYGGASDPDNQGGTNDKNITAAPLYFVRAGYVNQSFSEVGSYGHYWTAAPAKQVYFSPGYITYDSSSSNEYGYSIRCVAR